MGCMAWIDICTENGEPIFPPTAGMSTGMTPVCWTKTNLRRWTRPPARASAWEVSTHRIHVSMLYLEIFVEIL